jgi:hypothetical protein
VQPWLSQRALLVTDPICAGVQPRARNGLCWCVDRRRRDFVVTAPRTRVPASLKNEGCGTCFRGRGQGYAACSFALPSSLTRRKSEDHEAPRRFAVRFPACDCRCIRSRAVFRIVCRLASIRLVRQTARGAPPDGTTIFSVALRSPPASLTSLPLIFNDTSHMEISPRPPRARRSPR